MQNASHPALRKDTKYNPQSFPLINVTMWQDEKSQFQTGTIVCCYTQIYISKCSSTQPQSVDTQLATSWWDIEFCSSCNAIAPFTLILWISVPSGSCSYPSFPDSNARASGEVNAQRHEEHPWKGNATYICLYISSHDIGDDWDCVSDQLIQVATKSGCVSKWGSLSWLQ